MKKVSLLLAALLLVLLAGLTTTWTTASAKTSADFSDLKDLDAATKAKFDAMIEAGIFEGMSDGKFGLKDEMNRAQFAKVAALIFGLKVDEDLKTSSFSDVKEDGSNGWALPYIEAVKAAGITDGVGKGIYDPAGKVTKEQLAAFLVKGLGENEKAQSTPGVSDATVSDWAKGYVALALEKKLLAANPDGTFGGHSNMVRQDLVVTAYQTKQVVEVIEQEKKLEEEKKKEEEEKKKAEEEKAKQPPVIYYPAPSDTTAPLFASGYPMAGEAQEAGSKKVKILVQANEGGTAYYVVVPAEADAPSAAQVVNGLDSIGQPALAAYNSAISANMEFSHVTSVLPYDNTFYDVYVVVRDASGNATVPTLVNVRTPAAAVTTPVAEPEADVAEGVVPPDTAITLSTDTDGASIFYTLDNSDPTESSMPYTTPIPITSNTTIKAIAVKSGQPNSAVMSFTYTIDVTPPTLDASYPRVGAAQPAGTKDVEILVNVNEDARVYYVVVADGSTPPSTAQVIAGDDNNNDDALNAGMTEVSAGVPTSFLIEDLIAFETAYDVYFVVQDFAGNNATTNPIPVDITSPSNL